MDAAVKSRGTVKAKITRISKFLEAAKSVPVPSTTLETKLEMLRDYWKEFEAAQSSVDVLTKDDAMPAQDKEREEQEEKYTAIVSGIKSLIIQQQPNSHPDRSAHSHSQPSDHFVPKFEMPSFSGNFADWPNFKNVFTTMVHEKPTLKPHQKLHILKLALQGDAARLLSSTVVTDDNYDESWASVVKRYDHPRQLLLAQINILLHLPNCKSESAKELRKLLETMQGCLRSIKAMKTPTENWDPVLVGILMDKLDSDTRRAYEIQLKSTAMPAYVDIEDFIEQHCQALETFESSQKTKKPNNPESSKMENKKAFHNVVPAKPYTCIQCKGDHPLYKCEAFRALSVADRIATVKKNPSCFNCFRRGHTAPSCVSSGCRTCGLKHNTLLHIEKQPTLTPTTQALPSVKVQHAASIGNVLLATAVVKVRDGQGNFQLARALLDSASEASFTTESLVQRLGLQKKKSRVQITGLSQASTGTTNGTAEINLSSSYNSTFHSVVTTLILPKVTGRLPSAPFQLENKSFIENLILADPGFNVSGDIDLLLGADCFGELITGGTKHGSQGVHAIETVFGWVLTGKILSPTIRVHHACINVDEQLRKFWEVEEIPVLNCFSAEEQQCQQHFISTHTRNSEGRYIVQLPFKPDALPLGESRHIAEQCFYSLERRLAKNPELKLKYAESMEDYIASGHMVPVNSSSRLDESSFVGASPAPIPQPGIQHFFMPHHEVIKESSTTTKLRTVFNLSRKSSSGISLNERLMVGPKIQRDLLDLLISFRTHAVAFTADIEKMYRQILIHPAHQAYQQLLWRSKPEQELQEYVMKVVTFGEASAPYVAQQALLQLAKDEQDNYPVASEIVTRDFYMDDLMSGASNEKEAKRIVADLISLCSRGGFPLRKWSSNSSAVLESIPLPMRETQLPFLIDTDETVKTLGLHWNPVGDYFSHKVNLPPLQTVTKRTVLSDTARIFDPVGWASPSIIIAKMLLQELWLLQIGWDEPLPTIQYAQWISFRDNLPSLQVLKIPRQIADFGTSVKYELHGFCDASSKAYAAVVYLRCLNLITKEVKVNLIASKTRVAPVKQITLPRLELCGSVLLTRLLATVIAPLNLQIEGVYGWTDSTVVLAWISALPIKWKTFVANRVAEIQSFTPSVKWYHVKGQDNPADAPSRGVKPSDLAIHPLWWTGPSWLRSDPVSFPVTDISSGIKRAENEQRKIVTLHVTLDTSSFLDKFSSLEKLKRVTAYVRRFINNCKLHTRTIHPEKRITGPLTVIELNNALQIWIKATQQFYFKEELSAFLKSKPVPSNSKLLTLCPYLDVNGIIRVGGRLQAAAIPSDQMHPIVLPKEGRLTFLIVESTHMINLHAGPRLLQSTLQQQFWILSCRDVVRKIVHRCSICIRHRSATAQQLMGNLPSVRIRPQLPFYSTGLDFAGPLSLRVSPGRGGKTYKGYICVFVCMATKAIHLECVSDLTSDAFIASLRRFVSRRSNTRVIYSDNGTNFVGANSELQKLLEQAIQQTTKDSVVKFLSGRGIDWHFIPPAAPHMGGIWEAGVKSVKLHLRKILGVQTWTYEEMSTVLTQIEACLNSRPLTAMSSDPSDLSALTPGHFLVLGPMNAIPEPSLCGINISHMDRWQKLQNCVQQFWSRWNTEYLSTLQSRQKWNREKTNLQINDLVLIKDEQQPPCRWRLGRILELHPGPDGLVRVVTLKTEAGIKQRPLSKLCLLPRSEPLKNAIPTDLVNDHVPVISNEEVKIVV